MGKIALVRHGQTDWNRVNRIQGWRDIPLNSEGEKQAVQTAEQLSKLKIDAVYSSPLRRALQTAEKIAEKHGLNVMTVEEFKELRQGIWEGLLAAEARERFPSAYENWLRNPLNCPPPEGESVEDVRRRVIGAYSAILDKHSGDQTICIVSHKVVIAIIKCVHENIDLNNIHSLLPENAEWEIINEDFNRSL